MTAESLKAVCRLESKIMRDFPGFREACFRRNITIHGLRKEECCPSWSVGNYVASLSGRQTCQDVTDEDVKEVMTRLKSCAKFFNNGTLKENCWDYKNSLPYPYCVNIPLACVKDNAVFIIFYYLTDKEFLGTDMQEHLSYTQAFTPRWHRGEYSKAIYYRYLEGKTMEDGPVRLVGTDFYFLKFSMFNTKLLADIIYPSIALMIILIIMWFYTESILITILLAVSVVSALILAYFVNMIILRLNFFPFLNITTLIFLVGIGADDAFVFCDVWRQSKRDHPGASLKTVTYTTLRHASTSMFVTSFTTAAAFVANMPLHVNHLRLIKKQNNVLGRRWRWKCLWGEKKSPAGDMPDTRYRAVTPDLGVRDSSLSSSAAEARLKGYLKDLKAVEGETLHGIRAGCAITLALTGADLSEIMDHIGWSSRHTALYYMQLAKVLNRPAGASARLASESHKGPLNVWQDANELRRFVSALPAACNESRKRAHNPQ
ncbi:predicted protein [Nematostella vectensis]|uniref:SSD domain-containing protein n=1 Tax=Nematostella vectensis TaxID=45351 RepID=A7SM68_NEMVE|nr:predicted protein [Nematostella vectensis]|eukprot:XP_001627279.1 predicted protein [Nematostella vectensis]